MGDHQVTEQYPTLSQAEAMAAPRRIDLVVSSDMAARRVQGELERIGLAVGNLLHVGDNGVDELGEYPVWVEIDEDKGAALDRWLMAFDARVDSAAIPAAVAVPRQMVDPVTARVGGDVDILVAADAATRSGAMALLAAQDMSGSGVGESSSGNDGQLKRLSEEVQRIAAALSRLSQDGEADAASGMVSAPASGDLPELSVETVRSMIRARRLREDYFDKELFHDPAWDMMLDLLAAEIAQHRVPVSSLCMAAAVPPTTALRWMKTMVDRNIFLRRADPHDGRRVFVELSRDASHALRRYFAKLGPRFAV
ncbi:hypothetical protein [Sphingomicrobium sediminis]|uniref:HTH marR-type domain-containing protein n=1 Tax=Sphingomicrobium sediminis TaxID=2950949 RepID=A0A9X2EFY3_9SPHN|nr:hypothetical protein [Sphingomicrobium sediminis]MCM8557278.1 hypothetical protein [Sphingomicrobium sediminis]